MPRFGHGDFTPPFPTLPDVGSGPRSHPVPTSPPKEPSAMRVLMWILIAAVAAYLVVAMLRPDKF